jgi:hypothetical protein
MECLDASGSRACFRTSESSEMFTACDHKCLDFGPNYTCITISSMVKYRYQVTIEE